MATIDRRKGKFMARVRRRGLPPRTRTFDTYEEAAAWADAIERNILDLKDRGVPLSSISVTDLMEASAIDRVDSAISSAEPQCGVYMLFSGSECIYVGQSLDIRERIKMHRKTKPFDIYTWMPVDRASLSVVEMMLIAILRPRLNIQGLAGLAATDMLGG